MRMLSSMPANLRNRANELRMFAKAMNAPYILPETKESTRISMRNAAVELEHAVDTIDELRGLCADLYDHVDELKALARDMWACIEHVEGTDVHWDCTACPLDGTGECDFEGRMITLDVEVGE